MLEIRDLDKRFPHHDHAAVRGVSLTVAAGEFFALLGPSGCGKSTLLRLIAGLESPTAGDILLDGEPLTRVPAEKRPFNMIFQNYALFPHLNVRENVAFGLRLRKTPKAERDDRVDEALALVRMEGLAGRHVSTLSGGQQQRIAIARALVMRPRVLLLDEPLAALDLKLRQAMQEELHALQRRLGIAFIFVTHAQDEAFALSDRIAVMREGRIEQVAPPRALYLRPATLFAAAFVGNANIVRDCRPAGPSALATPSGFTIRTASPDAPAVAHVVLRPEHVRLNPATADNVCRAEVAEVTFKGPHVELRTAPIPALGTALALALSHDDPVPPVGAGISVGWRADHSLVVGDA